jgi:hypothetical protein
VIRLDTLVYGAGSQTADQLVAKANPVETQLGLLKAAFGNDQ